MKENKMGLEDIPQVQLANAGYAFVPANLSRVFSGKFVVLQGKERAYLMARKGFDPHKEIVGMFYRVAKDNYGVSCPETQFKVAGGGQISIGKDRIALGDESEEFGKYDETVARPLIENWAREYLPGAVCEFS